MPTEREFIEANEKQLWMLKDLLDIKSNNCHYCSKKLKKGDKFSIFNKPDRLVCHSILCLTDAVSVNEDEE